MSVPSAVQNAAHTSGTSASTSNRTPSALTNGGPPGRRSTASASSAPAAARYCEIVSSAASATLVRTRGSPRRIAASNPVIASTPAAVPQ